MASHKPGHPLFEKFFSGHLRTIPRGACMPNFKSIALAVKEVLAFNAQIFTGSRDLATSPFPSFDIQGLAVTDRRCLNYELLQSVHRP